MSAAGRSEAGEANVGRRSWHRLLEGGKTLASAAHTSVLGATSQPQDAFPFRWAPKADLANAAETPCLRVCKKRLEVSGDRCRGSCCV